MKEPKSITRKELYDLVWSKPVVHIAKDYGFSDNGIRKICKKHDIPLPKVGYWSKLKFNKKVVKEKLPEPLKNPKIKLEKTNPDLYGENSVQSKIKIKKRELETIETLSFEVPEKLYRPHIHVKNTKEYYKLVNKADKKRQWVSSIDSSKALSINVSKKLRPRALRVFDTIIKILEKRGHEFSIKRSKITILGETYFFNLRETNKRVKKKSDSIWREYEYVYESTGMLCFKVYSFIPLKEWYDSQSIPLEEKLINIIAWLEVKAEEDEQKRINREIRHKEQEELRKKEEALQQLKDAELEKFKMVLDTATRWHKSQYLRNYIKEYEAYVIKTQTLDADKKKWIQWAEEKADWYDPFVEKEDELLGDINKDSLEPKKKRYW